ncbi:MAG: NAD(P)-dependent oxidoreductase [Candidatus Omnitrophica bacterium]|nr:NAD(P)-dependent oxidoreductase [Candidatus Omnitrophota bacterium]
MQGGINKACEGMEVVFHLAAIPSIVRAKRDTYRKINVEGTRNVLQASLTHNVRKVIHVSSSTVYGVPAEFPLKETSLLHPIGKYGKSKLEAENLCGDFVQKGLDISIIRPRVIMGPGRIGIFSILFERIIRGQNLYIIGNGRNIFQFTHVADMSSACIKAAALLTPGLFNIGSEKTLPVREELMQLIRHANSRSRIMCLPALMARAALKSLSLLGISPLVDEQFSIADRDFKLDTTLAKNVLDWTPAYSNIDSLIQAFDWYAAHIKDTGGQYKRILGVLGKFKHAHMGGFQGS